MYKYKVKIQLQKEEVSIITVSEGVVTAIRSRFKASLASRNPKSILKIEVSEEDNCIYVDFESKKQLARPYQSFGQVTVDLLASEPFFKTLIHNEKLFSYSFSSLSDSLELSTEILDNLLLMNTVVKLVIEEGHSDLLEQLKKIMINDQNLAAFVLKMKGETDA